MQLLRDRKKRSVLRERSPTASWLPVLPERETRHIPVSRAAGGRLYQLQVYWEGHIRSVTHCGLDRSDKHDTLGTPIVSGRAADHQRESAVHVRFAPKADKSAGIALI